MALSQPSTCFLHLPPEIRNTIYDLAIETQKHHCNVLNLNESTYSPADFPLLYVHPIITTDLQHHLYGDEFSLVLPIQEPGEMVKGKGHNSESIQSHLDKLPELMKQRTKTLVVEMSQTAPMMMRGGGEDHGEEILVEDFWYYDNKFPAKLTPIILQFKRAIPSLQGVKCIFWLGMWYASLDNWQDALEKLAKDWVALEAYQERHNDTSSQDVISSNGTNETDDNATAVEAENDDEYNPAESVALNIYEEDLDPEFNPSGFLKPKFSLQVQFNLFDYSDPDAGDGGSNFIQGWDNYAEKTWNKDTTLQLDFIAEDLKWDEHVQGNFEGRQFDPKGWAHEYVNLMSKRDRDEILHMYYYSTDTCRPLYVKTSSTHG
ncbi:hypothetical protein F66182_3782 [Fusarium sp. NRRL 66182]|nr:hypothetical protein F66182_3782 [Fusarium sp. NRRL 66182]